MMSIKDKYISTLPFISTIISDAIRGCIVDYIGDY